MPPNFQIEKNFKFLFPVSIALEYYWKLQKQKVTFKGKKTPCLLCFHTERGGKKRNIFSEVMTFFQLG